MNGKVELSEMWGRLMTLLMWPWPLRMFIRWMLIRWSWLGRYSLIGLIFFMNIIIIKMNFPFLRSALKLYSMDNAHRVSLRPCCFVRLDVDSVTATLDKKTKRQNAIVLWKWFSCNVQNFFSVMYQQKYLAIFFIRLVAECNWQRRDYCGGSRWWGNAILRCWEQPLFWTILEHHESKIVFF